VESPDPCLAPLQVGFDIAAYLNPSLVTFWLALISQLIKQMSGPFLAMTSLPTTPPGLDLIVRSRRLVDLLSWWPGSCDITTLRAVAL
jgi:hypothetical protein